MTVSDSHRPALSHRREPRPLCPASWPVLRARVGGEMSVVGDRLSCVLPLGHDGPHRGDLPDGMVSVFEVQR